MRSELYEEVLSHFSLRLPFPVRSHIAAGLEVPVLPTATFFDYVIVNERRYWASSRNNGEGNSLVAVATGSTEIFVGELTDIFVLQQQSIGGTYRFGRVQWLTPVSIDTSSSAWSAIWCVFLSLLLHQSKTNRTIYLHTYPAHRTCRSTCGKQMCSKRQMDQADLSAWTISLATLSCQTPWFRIFLAGPQLHSGR